MRNMASLNTRRVHRQTKRESSFVCRQRCEMVRRHQSFKPVFHSGLATEECKLCLHRISWSHCFETRPHMSGVPEILIEPEMSRRCHRLYDASQQDWHKARCTWQIIVLGPFDPDDEGATTLRNVRSYSPNSTASCAKDMSHRPDLQSKQHGFMSHEVQNGVSWCATYAHSGAIITFPSDRPRQLLLEHRYCRRCLTVEAPLLQAVSRRCLTVVGPVRSKTGLNRICGRQSGADRFCIKSVSIIQPLPRVHTQLTLPFIIRTSGPSL